jgi:hypothetical protein
MNEKMKYQLSISLEAQLEVFALFSPDGELEPDAIEILDRDQYHYRVFPASSFPTIEALNQSRRATLMTSDTYPRTYEGLRIYLGLESWSQIFIISNAESLSDDQALCLRGCLNEQEVDKPAARPKSIIFLIKRGHFLSKDLYKFICAVIVDDSQPHESQPDGL